MELHIASEWNVVASLVIPFLSDQFHLVSKFPDCVMGQEMFVGEADMKNNPLPRPFLLLEFYQCLLISNPHIVR